MRLKVGRHASGDQFTIVGESEGQAIPDLDVLKTFPTRIPSAAMISRSRVGVRSARLLCGGFVGEAEKPPVM